MEKIALANIDALCRISFWQFIRFRKLQYKHAINDNQVKAIDCNDS